MTPLRPASAFFNSLLEPESDRQKGLVHPRRAQERHRLAIGDEAPRCDLAVVSLIEATKSPEVEAAEDAHGRERATPKDMSIRSLSQSETSRSRTASASTGS